MYTYCICRTFKNHLRKNMFVKWHEFFYNCTRLDSHWVWLLASMMDVCTVSRGLVNQHNLKIWVVQYIPQNGLHIAITHYVQEIHTRIIWTNTACFSWHIYLYVWNCSIYLFLFVRTLLSWMSFFYIYSIPLTSMADYHVPDESVSRGQCDYGRVLHPQAVETVDQEDDVKYCTNYNSCHTRQQHV